MGKMGQNLSRWCNQIKPKWTIYGDVMGGRGRNERDVVGRVCNRRLVMGILVVGMGWMG